MQEKINIIELENSLIHIKTLTEEVSQNLTNIDTILKENINSGIGVWDSYQAGEFMERWNQLAEIFPEIKETFLKQESNLELFINSMKQSNE